MHNIFMVHVLTKTGQAYATRYMLQVFLSNMRIWLGKKNHYLAAHLP